MCLVEFILGSHNCFSKAKTLTLATFIFMISDRRPSSESLLWNVHKSVLLLIFNIWVWSNYLLNSVFLVFFVILNILNWSILIEIWLMFVWCFCCKSLVCSFACKEIDCLYFENSYNQHTYNNWEQTDKDNRNPKNNIADDVAWENSNSKQPWVLFKLGYLAFIFEI